MTDANEHLHRDWIAMAQPDGLVVTASALKTAEANITWPVMELQATLKALAGEGKVVLEPRKLFTEILGWTDEFIVERAEMPDSLRVPLEGGEHLAPRFAVRSADDENAFVLLVGQPDRWNADLDTATDDKRWSATPHQKFERLLRETGVHVGLLLNGKSFRLVYAPKGESAGWVTFRLHEMLGVDGRQLLGAFHMLLNERRLLSLEPEKRLLDILKASREYQNTVSNALREQVLAALRELLRGVEHADRVANGSILADFRGEHLQEVYVGLVTALMRMVFILFAEERGLLPMENDLYASSYSLSRLYAQLVEDRGRFGDGIDDRYGAWARVTTLFRLLHDGVKANDGLYLPERRGYFFNPDAFPFLEGRPRGSARQVGESLTVPRVSDGVVFRVLDRLLVLGGERLQYRGLDVEQVGSVYEGLMGFELEVATGESLCLTPEHVVVNLEELVRLAGPERLKTLKANAGLDVKDKAAAEVKDAKTVDALQVALARRISSRQPGRIGSGSLYLQPGDERRKSGSHYTPKSLTSPIVETTLRPVLERLGPEVTPEQLLNLRICDPAMGSAAFLVEACRQLADHLVAAWRRTGTIPELPPDEDPVLHARRLIAQRCLYGVDKNPLAVDLARLSMWLVTFAKEHSFTFVDHALRCGDSLVGLSREQIANLALDVGKGVQVGTVRQFVEPAVKEAEELRHQIHAIGDPPDNERLVSLWRDANDALHNVRMLGDLVVAAFFSADSDKARKKAFEDLSTKVTAWLATGHYEAELKGMVADLREGEKPLVPFHWEIEFPEVFVRENPGFDCFVGNPPFLGGRNLSHEFGETRLRWLLQMHAEAAGGADLAAHFLRRSFALSRQGGTFGLIATSTICQGVTRNSGLRWIVLNGGTIYEARKRCPWPGLASVVISITHVLKAPASLRRILDGKEVTHISSYLVRSGSDSDPYQLRANANQSFQGSITLGMGFTFDDKSNRPGVNSIQSMHSLLKKDTRNGEVIFPYIGGSELNDTASFSHHRYVIDFGEATLDEAQRWPDLLELLKNNVKPERSTKSASVASWPWWQHWRPRVQLYGKLASFRRVLLTNAQASTHLAFAFYEQRAVFANSLNVFLLTEWTHFSILQGRIHDTWAWFLCSSLGDGLRYNPTDCFETFPFPSSYESNLALGAIGQTYYEFRAALMVKNNEGLTKTYNRFHDPEERSPDIQKLRDLHAEMDRAVLDAYGWTDIQPVYDFREQLDESTRLTWGEDTRDEVLARLLELNRVMAEEEAKQVPEPAPKKGTTKAVKKPKKGSAAAEASGDLFAEKGK